MLAPGPESPNKPMQGVSARGMNSVIDSVANKASNGPAERGGYFEVPGAHLYTVLHRVNRPTARALLVGPLAAERHNSYIPWVLWARYLAERGIEVLRYDYRGIGESSGAFEEMSFTDWSEDVHLLAKWLKEQSPEAPLVLHGLGVGALLASLAFHDGVGDALLLWSPPESANQALRSAVVRWINVEQLFKYGDERKPASAFIQELERGSSVEVEGYQFSGKLWQNSFLFDMPPAMRDEASARAEYKKPVRIIKLGREASPLVKAGTVADDRAKDFTWLFSENWQWIATGIDDTRKVQ
jgi:alpha/beta superfamily hydrolase